MTTQQKAFRFHSMHRFYRAQGNMTARRENGARERGRPAKVAPKFDNIRSKALSKSESAKLRVIVKRILRKYGYPPDKQELATSTVLQQAELLSAPRTEAIA